MDVDISSVHPDVLAHPRITVVEGRSVAPAIVARLATRTGASIYLGSATLAWPSTTAGSSSQVSCETGPERLMASLNPGGIVRRL